jgi:hypothetical protein
MSSVARQPGSPFEARVAPRHPAAPAASPAGVQPVDAVLLLYHRPVARKFKDASTVTEHIDAFPRYSRFPVFAVNTEWGPRPALRRLRFQAILLHYSMFGSGVYRLDEELLAYLRETDAYKVAFFQDEHYFCGKRFGFLDEYGVDCVYTCLVESEFDKVYGAYTDVPKLVSNLPGYASEATLMAARRYAKPDGERRVDVGYRGRPLAPNMGRGALEKTEVATRFAQLAEGTGLVLDIGTEETQRFYGDAWYEFMADCRCLLGVESGVSAFDLEDEIYGEYQRRLAVKPDLTIEDLADVLAPWEDRVYYRTISPRHFEAAAFGVTQVLFEGRYSDLMTPMVHYIPLRKDFSNFDEVVRLIKDPEVRRRLTDNAHRDLIASGRNSYAAFVQQVDCTLMEAGLRPQPLPDTALSLVRAALAEGRFRRQYAVRRVELFWTFAFWRHRLQELSHEVYVRTPAPVLRALRRVLDRARTA